MHDDLFDFFYEALPGYEQVGHRRILLGCWGSFQDPEYCNFEYKDMTEWGRKMFVTPGVVVDGKLVTTDLVEINLGIRILLGSSYYDDWDGPGDVRRRTTRWATRSTAGTRGTSTPTPSRRSATSTTSTAGSCRRAGTTARTTSRSTPAAARWPGCGRRRWPAWSTSATSRRPGTACRSTCRRPRSRARSASSGRSRSGATRSSATAPARTSRPTPPRARCTSRRRRWSRSGPAAPRRGSRSRCPTRASAAASPRPCAACCRHHMVIRDGKIANYHPYPPTPWNANPRDVYGTPGPVRGRRPGPADLRGERPGALQGHRHHADRPQLRPVPAVRRAHVPRRRQDAGDAALAHAVGHRRVTRSATVGDAARPPRHGRAHRGAARGERRPAARWRASAPRSWSGSSSTSTAPAWSGCSRSCTRPAGWTTTCSTGSPPTSWSPACWPVHGLHPYDVGTRVERALDGVRPYLGSHGGDVELRRA